MSKNTDRSTNENDKEKNENSILDEVSVGTIVVAGALLLAALTLPTFAPGTVSDGPDANDGTIVSPDGSTLEEVDGPDRGPLGGLNAIPASHLRDDESPTVHASAGAQTMRVETTTVGGEPALNLTDERTHDGRWVSVPTDWFNRTQGGVPSVARIAHEDDRTYTEAIQVRGDSAAFYVRGFSTNTVTFGGELVIRDRPAVDGTRHTYQLDSRDDVQDLSINVTGVNNTKWRNQTASGVSPDDTNSINIGGNTEPAGPGGGEPRLTVTDTSTNIVYNPIDDETDGTINTDTNMLGDQSFDSYVSRNIQIRPDQDMAPNKIVFNVDSVSGDDYFGSVPVYIAEGTASEVDSGTGTYVGDWNPDWTTGEQTFTLDSSPSLSAGTDYTITFDHTSSDGDGTPDSISIAASNDATQSFDYGKYHDVSIRESASVNDLSVSDGADESLTFRNLSGGETSKRIDIDHDSTQLDWSGSGSGSFTWELERRETTTTTDPVVELNGQNASYNGTLTDGETVDVGGSVSWLQDGQNNVTVHVGDGSYTGDGPEPQVDVEYRHDLESPRTVQYESEALSESYNISKTYTTARANASLTIPHARTVLSMRALDYRLNETGSWSSVPESAANLSGTTLTVDVSALAGDPVPEGTTIEVRSTGSRVDAHESSISVVRATPVGFDMDSRVRLDSWSSGSYLEVGETPQGGLVYYAENESYSAESDYVELYSDGSQRLYAPNASSGSEVTLQTLSARVSPERNSMRVRVPESANATNTEFVVEPASVVGDSWSAEYVAGTDGQWYAVVDDAGEELGAAEKPSPITVDRDDVGLVSIVPTEAPSASTDGAGGGVFATVTTGNLPSLLALFGSVGMLFVAGTRPAASRDAVDGFAAGVDGAVSRVPRIGPAVGGALESVVSGVGSALVSVGENRLLTGAVAAAVALAAAQADLFSVGSEAGAIISVAGIAVGSLYLLREAGEFTTARWIAIVGVAGVVALQGLGEGDLLAQFVNSDAFLIAVLIGGYAVIQLVREYRQNNSPDDDRPQVVIGGQFSSGDDEGSN